MPILSYSSAIDDMAQRGDVKAQAIAEIYQFLNSARQDESNIAFKSIGELLLKDSAVTSRKMAPTVNSVAMTADFITASTTFVDVTGASLTVTPEVTSTLIIFLTGSCRQYQGAQSVYARILVDSTIVRPVLRHISADNDTIGVLSGTFVATGITAGAHTVKLQAKSSHASYNADIHGNASDTVEGTKIFVLTIAE